MQEMTMTSSPVRERRRTEFAEKSSHRYAIAKSCFREGLTHLV
jgi:hypothetical protein